MSFLQTCKVCYTTYTDNVYECEEEYDSECEGEKDSYTFREWSADED